MQVSIFAIGFMGGAINMKQLVQCGVAKRDKQPCKSCNLMHESATVALKN
jgi:hypothetical protein